MWFECLLVALVGHLLNVDLTYADEGRYVRSQVTCPKPKVDNGKLFDNKAEYTPGDVDGIFCDEAYRLIGKDRLRCNKDGTWSSNPPYCEEITCQRPPQIMNGSIELTEPALIKTVAKFNCKEGFVLVGPPRLVCGVGGEWIPDRMPRCEEVQCPKLPEMHCLKPIKQPSVGDYVEFKSEEGFMLIGNAVIHCARNGSWVPNVIPYCEEITCQRPPQIMNGDIELEEPAVAHTVAKFHCYQGFVLVGPTKLDCGVDSKWSPNVMPRCEDKTTKWSDDVIIPLVIVACVLVFAIASGPVIYRKLRKTNAIDEPDVGKHQNGLYFESDSAFGSDTIKSKG